MKTWGTIQKVTTAVTVAVVTLGFTATAYADQYDDQIAALAAQASQAQAQANGYAAQASGYQAKVDQLDAQVAAINYQIQISQAQYDHITAQIAANTASLASQKAELGNEIKTMYLDSSITPLEILLSSKSISDFFDQQQYRDSVKTKIQDSMASIVALQAQLTAEQTQTATLLAQEKQQQQQADAEVAQANALLAEASQSVAAANAQVKAAQAQINSVRAAQAAMFASLAGETSGSGSITFKNLSFGGQCGGGYPANLCDPATDATIDQWGMYNRECVSYTAYRVAASGRTMPYWGGRGNATQWPGDAEAAGIPVSNTPQVGDVAIAPASMIGGVGHAMYVESIESGGWVHVSQYNWWPTENGPYGLYSEMDLKVTSGLEFIHFQ